MFQIDTDSYISMLRDLLLPKDERVLRSRESWDGLREGVGLLISIDLGMSAYDYRREESVVERALLHVLLCGHSSAFMAITDIAGTPDITPVRTTPPTQERGLDNTWRNVSNHDSCWISAIRDEINRIYFAWSEAILEELSNDDVQAPRDLRQHAWPKGIGSQVSKCNVVLRNDGNNGYPQGYGVVEISDVYGLDR